MLSRYHHPGTIHVSIRHTGQKRPETDADGRWRHQTEADGSRRKRKMTETELESIDFRRKFGPVHVGFPDILPDIAILAPSMLLSDTRTRSDPKRTPTEGGGIRLKLTEAENDRNRTRIGRFYPQIWPRACWVSRYDRPISSPWPQPCCHQKHGPEATRNGSRRQLAESYGSRRKLKGGN